MLRAPVDFDPADLRALSRPERAFFRLGRFVNASPRIKQAAQRFNQAFTGRWMHFVSGNRIHVVGVENLRALEADRGVVLAANHRSYFDMYMVLTHLHRYLDCRRVYFPVKAAFWYDHPLGVLVNLGASLMSMYPPIYRESEKRGATRAGLDHLAHELTRPGTVAGIHPEGTRNQGPDPYALLPPEQGFGRVVLRAKPIVVPIFINGMTNALIAECRSNFDGTGKPIIIVCGRPVDFGNLLEADPQRLRAQIAVGRRVLDEISALGRIEQRVRAELEAG